MARTVTTFFNMKENYSGGMRRAARATTEFQHKVTAAARVLDRENRKRREIKIQNRKATGAIAEVNAQMKKIKDLRINIAARTQNFKRDMKPVTNGIKDLVKKPLIVTLKLKDMALAGLRKAGDLLKTLAKGATIGLGIAAGALTYTLGKGATLQQYQASIEHNVFAANRTLTDNQVQTQAKAYANWLTDFAAKTTAGVDDIFAGGAHALAGTGGNVAAAKWIVNTAQDMAAQRPGSTTWDAVEAILDASMGQSRRMIEYGFKITDEAMKAAGGDIFKVKDQMGRTLTERFAGAEARKAQTGAGRWDAIKGTIEGGIMQAGSNILKGLTPLLVAMLPYADTLADKMADMGTSIGDWIANTIPKLGELWDNVKKVMTPFIEWINAKWDLLKPFRDFAANAFAGIDIDGEKVLGGITGAMDQLVNTLINWLNGLAQNWDKIEPVIAGIIKFLPQIALAFVGMKAIGWGMKTGKAVGNFFGGAGSLLGKLFGRGATTPAAAPDTVLNKPGTTTPKAGASTNTFTGPNYNTFQGPNYNAGNGGHTPGAGGVPNTTPIFLPPGASIPHLGTGTQPLGLPAGGQPWRLLGAGGKMGLGALGGAAGTALTSGIFALAAGLSIPAIIDGFKSGKFASAWKNGSGAMNFNPLSGFGTQETMVEEKLTLQQMLKNLQTAPAVPAAPDNKPMNYTNWELQKYMTLPVTTDLSAVPAGIKTILEGNTLKGNIQLMTYNGGGSGFPNLNKKEAAGVKRVPWDNYPALLHKGEAVLPSGEAGEYRSQGNRKGGGMTINGVTVHINGTNKDGKQLAKELIQGLQNAAFNMA